MRRLQQHELVDVAERHARDTALSRRTMIKAMGVGAGALALGSAAARAQEAMGPVAPPSTVTSPPRDFGPGGAPTTYFWDPDVIAVDPSFNGLAQPNSADPASVDRSAVGRRAGLERAGPLPRVQRHPEQPADALHRGRRPGHGVPDAVQQQQRQHLRLPRPADFVRASDAARGPLRARRLDHRAGRFVRGQAAQLAQRCRRPSRRQRLVHRPALWRAALRRRSRRRRRAFQRRGPAQSHARPGSRYRRVEAGAADPVLPVGPERQADHGRDRGPGRPIRTGFASRPTRRSCISPARARGRATPDPAAKDRSLSATSVRTTRCPTSRSSAIASSTE